MAELGVEKTDGDQKLSDFWKSTYLPHVKANLRPSTLHSYEDMWIRRIEPRFGKLILTEVKSSQITEFLSGLSNLNRSSVNHVRSLLSGIFSHAEVLGKVPFNPVRSEHELHGVYWDCPLSSLHPHGSNLHRTGPTSKMTVVIRPWRSH